MGLSDPLWYLLMSFGDRFPMEHSILGVEGSDKAS